MKRLIAAVAACICASISPSAAATFNFNAVSDADYVFGPTTIAVGSPVTVSFSFNDNLNATLVDSSTLAALGQLSDFGLSASNLLLANANSILVDLGGGNTALAFIDFGQTASIGSTAGVFQLAHNDLQFEGSGLLLTPNTFRFLFESGTGPFGKVFVASLTFDLASPISPATITLADFFALTSVPGSFTLQRGDLDLSFQGLKFFDFVAAPVPLPAAWL